MQAVFRPVYLNQIVRSAMAAFLLINSSCTTVQFKDSKASIPATATQDTEYYPVLEKWTRRAEVNSKFHKTIITNAVVLSEEMKRAYSSRLSRIRGDSAIGPMGVEAGKLGILVSSFTPDRPYLNLDDKNLWTASVNLVPDKVLLESFFPFVSQWSKEYLLIFEASAAGLSSEALVNPQTLSFDMRSALVNLSLVWP